MEIALIRMWVYSFSYLCVSRRFVQPLLKYFLPVTCYYFNNFIAKKSFFLLRSSSSMSSGSSDIKQFMNSPLYCFQSVFLSSCYFCNFFKTFSFFLIYNWLGQLWFKDCVYLFWFFLCYILFAEEIVTGCFLWPVYNFLQSRNQIAPVNLPVRSWLTV